MEKQKAIQILTDYLTYKNRSIRTVLTYSAQLKNIDLNDLSHLNAKANSSYNIKVSTLNALSKAIDFYEIAGQEQLQKEIRELELKKKNSKSYQPYSISEVKQILAVLSGFKRTAIWIALNAGLRREEIQNLNVDDIDFKQRKITVKRGKGDKMREVYVADLSTIQRWLEFRSRYFIEEDAIGNPLLFSARLRRPNLTSAALFTKATIAAKLDFRILFHRCRATYAVQLYKQSNYDVLLVSKQLGHADLAVTTKYLTLFPNEKQAKIQQIGELY